MSMVATITKTKKIYQRRSKRGKTLQKMSLVMFGGKPGIQWNEVRDENSNSISWPLKLFADMAQAAVVTIAQTTFRWKQISEQMLIQRTHLENSKAMSYPLCKVVVGKVVERWRSVQAGRVWIPGQTRAFSGSELLSIYPSWLSGFF